jgi:hypothetical protein
MAHQDKPGRFDDRDDTPVQAIHAWSLDLDKMERRTDRRIAEAHERQSIRIRSLEDEISIVRRDAAQMSHDLVAIQGKDGRGGAIGSLVEKVDALVTGLDKSAEQLRASQAEASRERAANRRVLVGLAVSLAVTLAGAALVMHERQLALEAEVSHQARDTRAVKDQLDRIESMILPRALNPAIFPTPAPSSSP